jgi:hypothetical protein
MIRVEEAAPMAVAGIAVVGGVVNGDHYGTNSAQKAALSLAATARALGWIEATRSAVWDQTKYRVADKLVAANFPSKTVTLDLSGSGGLIVPATIQAKIFTISVNPPLKRILAACLWQPCGGPLVPNTLESCRAPS